MGNQPSSLQHHPSSHPATTTSSSSVCTSSSTVVSARQRRQHPRVIRCPLIPHSCNFSLAMEPNLSAFVNCEAAAGTAVGPTSMTTTFPVNHPMQQRASSPQVIVEGKSQENASTQTEESILMSDRCAPTAQIQSAQQYRALLEQLRLLEKTLIQKELKIIDLEGQLSPTNQEWESFHGPFSPTSASSSHSHPQSQIHIPSHSTPVSPFLAISAAPADRSSCQSTNGIRSPCSSTPGASGINSPFSPVTHHHLLPFPPTVAPVMLHDPQPLGRSRASLMSFIEDVPIRGSFQSPVPSVSTLHPLPTDAVAQSSSLEIIEERPEGPVPFAHTVSGFVPITESSMLAKECERSLATTVADLGMPNHSPTGAMTALMELVQGDNSELAGISWR